VPVNDRGYPESFRELWHECTPVMRWRLVVILAMIAGLAVEVVVLAGVVCVLFGAVVLVLA
jgi:hypothetical protein